MGMVGTCSLPWYTINLSLRVVDRRDFDATVRSALLKVGETETSSGCIDKRQGWSVIACGIEEIAVIVVSTLSNKKYDRPTIRQGLAFSPNWPLFRCSRHHRTCTQLDQLMKILYSGHLRD
jgi:hypothetical protein